MPVRQSPTPRSPMATFAETALYTLRRRTPLSHSPHRHYYRHHRRQHFKLPNLPPMPSRQHHHLSPVFTAETGVEGTRRVRNVVLKYSHCFYCLDN